MEITSNPVIKSVDILRGAGRIKIRVTKDNEPVTNLAPYLGSFGHLVMIHTEKYRYTHVHPFAVPLDADDRSGPDVEFGIFGQTQPGLYRIFIDLAPNGQIITFPLTIEVQ